MRRQRGPLDPNRVRKSRSDFIPRWAENLLRWSILRGGREHIPGDLEEEFHTVVFPARGWSAARRWYIWQVMKSIGPLLVHELLDLYRAPVGNDARADGLAETDGGVPRYATDHPAGAKVSFTPLMLDGRVGR